MISSTNAFGGMSAADLMKLFGANSSSSSSPTSTSPIVANSAAVSVSSVSDSAKTIQTILAEAEINKAPTATSGGSTINASVAAAYVAHTGGASASTSASGSDTLAAVGALTDQVDAEVYQTLAPSQGWDPQEHVAGASGSSLVVATASGVTATATAEGGAQSVVAESVALDAYQWNLEDAQYEEANTPIPDGETSAASASPSDDTSGSAPNSGYLLLTIRAINGSAAEFDAAEAQAQQLTAAFKDHTLTSTSSDVTGFSYANVTNGDAEGFTITGIKINSSEVLGGMSPTSDVDTTNIEPALKNLLDQSTAIAEGGGIAFAIPLES